jgi:hypothetical protein
MKKLVKTWRMQAAKSTRKIRASVIRGEHQHRPLSFYDIWTSDGAFNI